MREKSLKKGNLSPYMIDGYIVRNRKSTAHKLDGLFVTHLGKMKATRLDVSSGFRSWIQTKNVQGQIELRRKLNSKIREGKEVWASVINGCTLVGYAVVGDAEGLPGAKVIETIEVSTAHRRAGIGSAVLSQIIEAHRDTIVILDPSPEQGFERKLPSLYRKFGFRHIGELMFRIPSNVESTRSWIPILTKAIKTYDTMVRQMKKASKLGNHSG